MASRAAHFEATVAPDGVFRFPGALAVVFAAVGAVIALGSSGPARAVRR